MGTSPRHRLPGTHIGAVLPCGLGRQRPDPLPVELGSAAVVLGIGVAGGAAVLVEEGGLWGEAAGCGVAAGGQTS